VVIADGARLFEVTMRDAGIRLYRMDAHGAPSSVKGLSGTVLLKARRGRRMSFELKAVPGSEGESGYLEVARDLSSVKDHSRTVMFSLKGFGGDADRASVFTRFARTHLEPSHGHGHGHDDHGHGHDDHGHGHDDHGGGHDDHGGGHAHGGGHDDQGHGHGHDHGGHGHDH
jgi:hypothetical protein